MSVWRAIISDLWDLKAAEAESARKALRRQIKEIDGQIEKLLDRIVEGGSSQTVLSALEDRVEKLERQKIVLAEQAERSASKRGDLNEFIEPALSFLTSPWKIYQNSGLALKRTVLKLAFAEPLRYSRNEGYRIAEISFPFKVLRGFSAQKCGMVGDPGSPTSPVNH